MILNNEKCKKKPLGKEKSLKLSKQSFKFNSIPIETDS